MSLPIHPFKNVDSALMAQLDVLKRFVPMANWMISRLDGEDFTVAKTIDTAYGVKPGTATPWEDTYCAIMARGEGPNFAEDAQSFEPYRNAPVNRLYQRPIAAYIGLPLIGDDGAIIGSLCAIDPEVQPTLTESQRVLVQTSAATISTLLAQRQRTEAARQEAARQRYAAETDALTGLNNRRGWDEAVADEEEALSELAQNAMVFIIDLDDLKVINDEFGHEAGDRHLKLAADVIRSQFRPADIVARIGGDEFAVLVREARVKDGATYEQRLRSALDGAMVSASVGVSYRLQHQTLEGAMAAADEAMYRDKEARKAKKRHTSDGSPSNPARLSNVLPGRGGRRTADNT